MSLFWFFYDIITRSQAERRLRRVLSETSEVLDAASRQHRADTWGRWS